MNAKQLKWFLLVFISLIWGSSFILIKKGLVGLNPFQLGALRMIFAALFLLVIGFRTLSKIPAAKWKFIVLTALLGTFFPAFLFAIAETRIGSSVTGMLNSFTPLNTLVLGAFLFGLNFKRTQIIGVAVGLVGSLLLVFSGSGDQAATDYSYVFLVFIATICYGTNVNLIKKYLSDLSPLTISTGNFTAMLIPSLIILFFSGFFGVMDLPQVQHSVLFIIILGVVGTGIANLLFFRLIQMSTPVFAASVTYLIPIVAFFWGLLDNEMLTPFQFLGACIILFGVYLSGKK
ncbi:MAG TPA: DMT family transporter [Flavobacterium sp.]|nr:DMT family transporter [Flavobacterium sp.]